MQRASEREVAVRRVEESRAGGVRIGTIGTQGHLRLAAPASAAIDASIAESGRRGYEPLVSELNRELAPKAARPSLSDAASNSP